MLNNFELRESDILLAGTSGEQIAFRKIKTEDDSVVILLVLIFLDWMQATIPVETSEEALARLRTDLKRMIDLEVRHFDFVSVTADVSIEFALHALGTIKVSCVFMRFDSQVEFSFQTDLTYLPTFYNGLSSLLQTVISGQQGCPNLETPLFPGRNLEREPHT